MTGPVGRCERCRMVVPVEQRSSGIWRTTEHFGCLGSLLDPHDVYEKGEVPKADG